LFYCRINYRSQRHTDRMNVKALSYFTSTTHKQNYTKLPPITRHSVMKQTKQTLTHLCSFYNSINSFFRHCCNVMLIQNCQFVWVSKAANKTYFSIFRLQCCAYCTSCIRFQNKLHKINRHSIINYFFPLGSIISVVQHNAPWIIHINKQ